MVVFVFFMGWLLIIFFARDFCCAFFHAHGWLGKEKKEKKGQEMERVLGEALRSPLFFILWVMGPGSPDQKIKDPSTILTNPTCFFDSFIFPALFLFLSA